MSNPISAIEGETKMAKCIKRRLKGRTFGNGFWSAYSAAGKLGIERPTKEELNEYRIEKIIAASGHEDALEWASKHNCVDLFYKVA